MVLILDTETTGLDTNNDRIIEVAWQVTSDDFKETVQAEAFLIKEPDHPPISKEITEITGISQEDMKFAVPLRSMFESLFESIKECLVARMIAYNSPFDSAMIRSEMERIGLVFATPAPLWRCAMNDNEKLLKFKCRKLSHAALDLGVPIDPSKLHRAAADVELTRLLLVASNVTLHDIERFANIPWLYVVANVPHPREPSSEEKRRLAKEHGYAWESIRGDESGRKFPKRWVKRIKETDYFEEEKRCPLKVSIA